MGLHFWSQAMNLWDLWLPIVAAGAAVWVWSAVAWMALPTHRKDYRALPDEDAFLNAVRGLGLRPGNYSFPDCSTSEKRNDPAMQEKWKTGPMGTLAIWPGMNMGRNMVLTLLVQLVVSAVIAYLGSMTLQAGEEPMRVFRVLGTAGVLAYSFAFIPNGIWFNHGRAIFTNMFDGVVAGLITGAIFAWLWPGA